MAENRTWVIVVAAGTGSRFGGPKQYAALGDRRVLDWSIAAARTVADGVVLVVAPGYENDVEPSVDVVVVGGATRSGSVRAGLAAVPAEAEVILVHDAARPLATPDLFRAVVDAVEAGAEGAVPGVPVVDTIKRVEGDRVIETLERSTLVAVQTPQGFRAGSLRSVHEAAGEGTDDAALIEAIGGRVDVVPGEETNRKLTLAADLDWARERLR